MFGFFTRFFSGQRSINNPAVPLTSETIVNYLGNQGANRSGVNVNENTVFTYSPVWQAVTQISGDLAKMKINLFEDVTNADGVPIREKVENEISQLVKRPNDQQNWNKFWKRFWVQSLLYNRGYIYIDRNRNGDASNLYVLMSDRTSWNEDQEIYTTQLLGDKRPIGLFPSEVIEVEGIQLENQNKCELLDKFRESIGLGLAAQGHNAKFFGNGGQMGGILMIPPQISKEASDKLEQGWHRKYSNENAWFKTAILRDGVRYQQTGADPEKSQLSQVREDQVYEVARWFNLAPSRLGLTGASSYNSKHEDNQNYLDQTLSPWMASLTSELSFKLLTTDEQGKQYFSFDTSQLLALNPKLRAETNKIRIDMGEISPNEARLENGLPPRIGGDGYRLPSGVLIEGSQPPSPPESPAEDEPVEIADEMPDQPDSVEERAIAQIRDQAESHIQKFENIIRERAAKKSPEDFEKWLSKKTEGGLAIPLDVRQVDLSVTAGMVDEARRGLAWRKEYGRGGTLVGVTRANQIIRDKTLSEDTWRRVKAYFDRHEVDKQAEGFSPGEDGFPSAGRIAWALWGGDAGYSRAKTIVERLDAENE